VFHNVLIIPILISINYSFSKSATLSVYEIFARFPFRTTINFSMATVYPFNFVLPSASSSVSFLFGFLVTGFTVDEITFICVPRPLGSPSQYQLMKLAIASCFLSSPLWQVMLFREELRPGVTSPPDHVPDPRTAIAIQPPSAAHLFYGLLGPAVPPPPTFSMDYLVLLRPPPLTFSMNYLVIQPPAAHLFYGLLGPATVPVALPIGIFNG
jgi:hypothetical protein